MFAPLTPRQKQVLQLWADGLKMPDIEKDLFITNNTLKFHSRLIRRNLQARTIQHAVAIGFREGILT
jgi:DNA-binding NarL/FixJ family response regulator